MKRHHYLFSAMLLVLAACSNKDKGIAPNYKVDENASVITWKGSAPTHFHKGSFKVSGSLLTNGDDRVTGGDFTIPIASIDNEDLSGPPKLQLLNHLKSDTFFNVPMYPEAKFHVTKVEDFKEASVPGINAKISGEFTMIGQTHPLSFPAAIQVTKDKISATGSLKLPRLDWGMNAYSDPAGPLYILPEIEISIDIKGTPAK